MKSNLQVVCPNCKSQFKLDSLLLTQFEKEIKKDFQEESQRREIEFSEQLNKIRKEIKEQTKQESLLKIKGQEKLITDLKEQLTKATHRLENGSQQLQGEVQEIVLESILTSTYPSDLIEEISKGVRGADCIQYVQTKTGVQIGSILYESKNVKSFSMGWIDKLKKDNLISNCDLTVIVTSTMPPDMSGKFGIIDGTWICLFEEEAIRNLTAVLRFSLLKVYQITQSQNLSNTESEKLFKYITSAEFQRLFESVLQGFNNLEQSFQDEKKKLTTLWKVREQHLQQMLSNTLELYGSMKGISSQIPDVSALEFRKAG